MRVGFRAGSVCLTLLMALAPLTAATQNANTGNSTSKPNTSNPNSQTAKQMSQLATRLLQHADEARHAISTNQKQSATTHINQALANWNQLSSLAKSKNLPMIVPLYSEFDESSTLGPLIAARKGNQPPKAKQPANAYTPVTVEQASGEFTFIGLDLAKAKQRLDAAKTALDNGNTQAASDSLNALETD